MNKGLLVKVHERCLFGHNSLNVFSDIRDFEAPVSNFIEPVMPSMSTDTFQGVAFPGNVIINSWYSSVASSCTLLTGFCGFFVGLFCLLLQTFCRCMNDQLFHICCKLFLCTCKTRHNVLVYYICNM